MNNSEDNILDELIEAEIVTIDEEGLPVKSKKGKVQNYSVNEVVAIILPYVYENISVSSREIVRRTGLFKQKQEIGMSRKIKITTGIYLL